MTAAFAAEAAGSAGHLEGNRDPLAGPQAGDAGTDSDHLCGDLMADRIRAGEDPEAGHGGIEVAAGDREWPHNRVADTRFGVRGLLPFQHSGPDEDQVFHGVTIEPEA